VEFHHLGARLAGARLYLVCDATPGGRPLADVLPAALRGGVDVFQLRCKDATDDEILAAADPVAKPKIITNTLAEPEDLAALVTGVELAREIAGAEPLLAARGREIYPGADIRDDADVEDYVRRSVELLYHPSGTCRMGGEDAVLDPELRVRGIEGLRVIDASVFPIVPGGNTNAPTIMVAERAADLIRGRIAAPAATA